MKNIRPNDMDVILGSTFDEDNNAINYYYAKYIQAKLKAKRKLEVEELWFMNFKCPLVTQIRRLQNRNQLRKRLYKMMKHSDDYIIDSIGTDSYRSFDYTNIIKIYDEYFAIIFDSWFLEDPDKYEACQPVKVVIKRTANNNIMYVPTEKPIVNLYIEEEEPTSYDFDYPFSDYVACQAK